MGCFATCQIIIYVTYSNDHVRPYLCSCSHWEEFLCYKQDRWFKSQCWGGKIKINIHILIVKRKGRYAYNFKDTVQR